MGYVPNTDADRREMLAAIGVDSVRDLFRDIPDDMRDPTVTLADPISELEAVRHLRGLAARNDDLASKRSFLGAGAYRHYVPSVVNHILMRGEFYTAYTPYQPEISQGTLQTIYEYQSMLCALTGMDVANASMYEGGSALAEAVLRALHITRRTRIILAGTIHPQYRDTVRTYLAAQDVEIVETPFTPGDRGGDSRLEPDALDDLLDDRVACVCIQQPNFLGAIEDLHALAERARARGALVICAVDPISLGLLEPPGNAGVDIVVGEGQSLGIGLGFGGPYLGLFAARSEHVRQMPGRIVGETTDLDGRRGYVLALQTREQHIRRERATSNICTNQALCALAATVYLATMGKHGLRRVAELCVRKAHYAAAQIDRLKGFSVDRVAPFFKEFVVHCPVPVAQLNHRLLEDGFVGGYDLGRSFPRERSSSAGGADRAMLVCVTEMNTRDDIDDFVRSLNRARAGGHA